MNNINRTFQTLRKSKDAQRVFANFSYLSILQISSYALPMITYPYLAKIIGVDGFGNIALAMSICAYFMTLTDWGYNFTATCDIAKNRNHIDTVSEIYSVVTTCKLYLLFVSSIIWASIVIVVPYFRNNFILYIFAFSTVIGHTIFPEWLYQGMENMKLITILNLSSKILCTIFIFVFVRTPNDYIYQPLFSGLGYIIAGCISILYVHKKLKIRFYFCNLREVQKSIQKSFDVFLNNLMPNLYTNISVIILGFYNGNVATGIIDGANKLYTVCAQFLTVLSRVFFPFLSRRIEKHAIFVKIKLSITIAFVIILEFGADILIKTFLNQSFESSILPLRIFGISLFFHALTNIYGTNYLIIIGEAKLLRKITMVVSLLGFAFAFPLIYFYSYIGAACTMTLARITLGLSVYYVAKKN